MLLLLINVHIWMPRPWMSVLILVCGCVVVKPDPPVNVSVMVMPGRKLSVQWAPPPTWPDPVNFLLKYTVKFHWGKPEMARTVGVLCLQSQLWSTNRTIKQYLYILFFYSLFSSLARTSLTKWFWVDWWLDGLITSKYLRRTSWMTGGAVTGVHRYEPLYPSTDTTNHYINQRSLDVYYWYQKGNCL